MARSRNSTFDWTYLTENAVLSGLFSAVLAFFCVINALAFSIMREAAGQQCISIFMHGTSGALPNNALCSGKCHVELAMST